MMVVIAKDIILIISLCAVVVVFDYEDYVEITLSLNKTKLVIMIMDCGEEAREC